MELELVIVNKIRRGKIPVPVKEVADEEFNLYIYKEKWNIVRALSRLAFWDERRLLLCRKCKQPGVTPKTCIDEAIIDLISNTLIPYY
jgi:hypothetical protein